ncbi:hypothetical protein MTYP_01064 [Methylophilaceae bacterium]|nr:hypothetical protein MTYP_01064 [Methylophilaceae bacterium]
MLAAFLLFEDERQMTAAGDAGGVEGEHGIPRTARRTKIPQHGLEARAVVVLAGLHRIGVFAQDENAARLGEIMQRAALGID